MKKGCLLFILLFSSITLAESQKQLKIHAIGKAEVKVDAYARESFWGNCETACEFIQKEPDEGNTATESTCVKIAYSDEALYLYAEMFHTHPDKIIRQMTRRDRWISADNFFIDIDAFHDHRNAVRFEVNAGNTQRDGLISNDEAYMDQSWDCIWHSATRMTDSGWSLEMEIPFSCLWFRDQEEHTFGINLFRYIAHKKEMVSWIPRTSYLSGYVSRFGHLEGIRNIKHGNPLEFLPYAGLNTEAFSDVNAVAGLDMKYNWQNNIVINATLNPDFGQVEADRAVLNLSAYETFYPEKRPFFLEGVSIFNTPYRLFYSRRIGRPPTLDPEVPEGGETLEEPVNTTILGAGKITGKFKNGIQFGLIEAVTQEEKATVVDSLGVKSYPVVEPLSLYQTFRIKKDVFSNSQSGIMLTSVNNANGHHVYTGGTDWNIRLPHKDYRSMGQIVGSMHPDEGRGYGGRLIFEKTAGERVRGNISLNYDRPNLELNDVGFFGQPDRKGAGGHVQLGARPNKYTVRKIFVNFHSFHQWNFDNTRVGHFYGINNSWNLEHLWFIHGFNSMRTCFDDKITGDGPDVGLYPNWHYWIWGGSDGSKPVYTLIKFGITPENSGGSSRYNGGILGFNLFNRINLELDSDYGIGYARHKWVTDVEDNSGDRADILARLKTERFSLTTRAISLFTNNLSLQLYNQLFFAKGDYTDFHRLIGGFDYTSMAGVTYEEDPDFFRTVFNTSLLLRWEYRPGSTLYVVWSQGINRDDISKEESLFQGINALRSAEKNNTFLIKVSYRFAL